MKKLSYLFTTAFVVVIAFASCDKKPTTTTPTTPTPTTPSSPAAYTPAVSNVDGVLAAIKMNFKIEQQGFTFDVVSEIGTAAFYNGTGSTTLIDGGTVKLNSNELEKQTNFSYIKNATTGQTPSDLGLSSGASWSVGGTGNVPAFTYNHGSTFPSYSDALPKSITKSSGLTVTFNSSNTKNADSVYVFISSGSATFIKGYSATAGSVTISSSELSHLPTVSDNTGILEILPVKMTLQTFSGKKYAIIKEEANVTYININ